MTNLTDKQSYLFDRPEVIKWMLRIFYAICVFLVLIDFLIHRHVETSVERVPAFYAIYGFISCVALVLLAKQLRKLLMRDENYYEPNTDNSSLNDDPAKQYNIKHDKKDDKK